MGGSPRSELDALIKLQLEAITTTLRRLETAMDGLSDKVDSVRVSELAAIRTNLSDTAARLLAELAKRDGEIARHDADLKLLRYQMGRTTAVWSLVSGGVASAIVAAVMALVMHR